MLTDGEKKQFCCQSLVHKENHINTQMASTSLPLSSGGVKKKKKKKGHTGKSKLPHAAAATANELRLPVTLFFLSPTSSRRGGGLWKVDFLCGGACRNCAARRLGSPMVT